MSNTASTPPLNATVDRHALEEFLTALDAIVDEATIESRAGEIRTKTVDPASVALAEASLAPDAFADAPAPGGERFGIRVPQLRDLLTDAETVGLDYDPDTRNLDLSIGPYRYTHATIKAEHVRDSDGPPEMDLAFEARLDGDRLREAVEWFDEFTTHVGVGYDPDAETFWMAADERSGNSIGTDDGRFELSRGDLEAVREHGHADSMYSTDYFRKLVDAIPEGREVTIHVGEEFPMLLAYPIHDGAGEACGRVVFMQAPRIQSD
jgi:proliferating cell nuclear antigen